MRSNRIATATSKELPHSRDIANILPLVRSLSQEGTTVAARRSGGEHLGWPTTGLERELLRALFSIELVRPQQDIEQACSFDVFKARVSDQEGGNFRRTLLEEPRRRVPFRIVIRGSHRASCVLVFFQTIVAMRHEMADAKETEIDPADCMLRTFS
jgi:hypothetical protein